MGISAEKKTASAGKRLTELKPCEDRPITSIQLSFEFFPPRTDADVAKLARVRNRLAALDPEYFSVTYGAGGSTRQGTIETVMAIKEAGFTVSPHLSFGSDDHERLVELLESYQCAGIDRVVALRGDIPSGQGTFKNIRYAGELVELIRKTTGDYFHIDVAAYPEVHPDSTDLEFDLKYFKQKVDAGADSAITQYFYNPDAYFAFLDECQKLGISIPVFPGIMPITNYDGLVRFSKRCQAEIPRWILKRLESFKDDRDSLRKFGDEVVTKLCQTLLDGGAPGIHFYTLNQSLPSITICRNLAL